MKAALEKAGWDLEFEPIHYALSSSSVKPDEQRSLATNLFDLSMFQLIIQQESWKIWIEDKVLFKCILFKDQ